MQTAEISAMIFVILLGAEVFDAFLGALADAEKAAEFVTSFGLPPFGVVALLMLFYILLGAVMDELAMILLTLPVFFPIVVKLDLGLPPDEIGIWFGILVLIGRRHRTDRAADRAQCLRRLGDCARRADRGYLSRRAALRRRRCREARCADGISVVDSGDGSLAELRPWHLSTPRPNSAAASSSRASRR